MSELPDLVVAEPGAGSGAALMEPGLVVVGTFEGEAPETAGLPGPIAEAAGRLAARPGWRGHEEQRAEAGLDGGPVVVLQGLGKSARLTSQALCRRLRDAVDGGQKNGFDSIAVALPEHPETTGAGAAERVGRALLTAAYRFDRFQTERVRPGVRVRRLVAVPPAGAVEGYRSALAAARAIAAGIALTRDLANTPANEANPAWMEERCRELAADRGMRVTVLDAEELGRRGMGGLVAVGSGSSQPPRLVRLDLGEEGPTDRPTVAMVGKGVTFDTGGISLKPADKMAEMKYDKCGACTVLGAALAVAELALPVALSVYLPLAENMPDGSSCRPGDIVRCYNGKTVEILNTDAEGRMILADALAWAAEEEPASVLEMSTLTGASVVALGHEAAALYTPDEGLAGELTAAAAASGDRLWRMPMFPEVTEQLKGDHADLKNLGGRWGGANFAAAFLGQFVGELTRWAHLDIAGVAYVGENHDEPKGATGWGVHLAVEWLRATSG
jgi:leucyl aminopeptidase